MRTGDPIELLLKQAFPVPIEQADWEAQLLKALGRGRLHLAPVRKLELPGSRGGMFVQPPAEAA
jgi:hypothetical protein